MPPAEPGKDDTDNGVSAIFWHMMPRSLSFVLIRMALAAFCLAVIVLATAWPVRHALVPMWPSQVDELLLNSGDGEVRREFLGAGAPTPDSALARNRPLSLWRVETEGGGVILGWLAGARDDSGALMDTPPAWLDAVRLDAPLPGAVELVLTRADRSKTAIAGEAVRRMYGPNRLRLLDRGRLWFDRLAARWRWPWPWPVTSAAD